MHRGGLSVRSSRGACLRLVVARQRGGLRSRHAPGGPELSRFLGPLTYGRWAPVHLNLTLYGALAVPWVGVLLFGLRGRCQRGVRGRWALAAWSVALTLGAASWLGGQTSGKLFLDWVGPAKWAFLAAQIFLALVLLESLLSRRSQDAKARWGLLLLWGLLAMVPWAMARASGSAGYPPVNPASGGPTGNSLLGSSLGLVFAVWLTPRLLGLSLRDPSRGRGLARLSFLVFATQCLLFWALGMGDHSIKVSPPAPGPGDRRPLDVPSGGGSPAIRVASR